MTPPVLNLSAKIQTLGHIEVDGILQVIDPVYTDGELGLRIMFCKAGRWRVQVEISDEIHGWGKRISRLVAEHVDHLDELHHWVKDGEIGVDSGQVSIGDGRRDFDAPTAVRYGIAMLYEGRPDNKPGDLERAAIGARSCKCDAGFGDGRYEVFTKVTPAPSPVGIAFAGETAAVMVELITPESAQAHIRPGEPLPGVIRLRPAQDFRGEKLEVSVSNETDGPLAVKLQGSASPTDPDWTDLREGLMGAKSTDFAATLRARLASTPVTRTTYNRKSRAAFSFRQVGQKGQVMTVQREVYRLFRGDDFFATDTSARPGHGTIIRGLYVGPRGQRGFENIPTWMFSEYMSDEDIAAARAAAALVGSPADSAEMRQLLYRLRFVETVRKLKTEVAHPGMPLTVNIEFLEDCAWEGVLWGDELRL